MTTEVIPPSTGYSLRRRPVTRRSLPRASAPPVVRPRLPCRQHAALGDCHAGPKGTARADAQEAADKVGGTQEALENGALSDRQSKIHCITTNTPSSNLAAHRNARHDPTPHSFPILPCQASQNPPAQKDRQRELPTTNPSSSTSTVFVTSQ